MVKSPGTDASAEQDTGKKRKPLFKQRAPSDAYDISRYQHATALMLEVRATCAPIGS